MLAVLSRYKLFLVILLLIITAALIWLYIAVQGTSKTPTRGVFVMEQTVNDYSSEGGGYFAAGNDAGGV